VFLDAPPAWVLEQSTKAVLNTPALEGQLRLSTTYKMQVTSVSDELRNVKLFAHGM
jgi:hypothetical protein